MLFASAQFIFFFLPIVILIYYIPRRTDSKNLVLLFVSLVFYFWGEAQSIYILIGTVFLSYFIGLLIQLYPTKKLPILNLGIVVNLSLLVLFKYSNFIAVSLNSLLSLLSIQIELPVLAIHLPLGISFFVFHAISYLIDIYRQRIKAEKNIFNLSLYFFLFPHQIAGPIVRYEHFAENIDKRLFKNKDLVYGIERFILGLAKKVLIANSVAKAADNIFALPDSELSFSLAWIGAICYTIQIFFDFSGYSDMAIGLARVFGFHFHENFNFPYVAKSITDFWRRWHISLSSWFRDYLYIPLGGNQVSPKRNYLNLLIVFLFCGLWHGASWTFIIWGLWHGIFLMIERTGIEKKFIRNAFSSHVWTLFIIIIGWVFFRSDSTPHAIMYIKNLFAFDMFAGPPVQMYLDFVTVPGIILGILFSSGFFSYHLKGLIIKRKCFYEILLIGLLIISMSRIAGGTFNPFIYYRF